MKTFRVNKKSGFVCAGGVARIFKNGKIFYLNVSKNGKKIYFNLPAGVYTTDNEIKLLPRPLRYKVKRLPAPERYFTPKTFDITIGKNPNKVSIWVHTGKVLIDADFWETLNEPQRKHCLYHEYGHYFYSTEWKCDLYAARKMLKEGFSPSQVFQAVYFNLSPNKEANHRKKIIYNYAKNCTIK